MNYTEYETIILSAYEKHEKSSYGDLWKKFSLDELLYYAVIKSKRAFLVPARSKKIDDILDAINLLVFALNKMRGQDEDSEAFSDIKRDEMEQ